MKTYIVLKTLPKGQRPGDTVELNDDEAAVFIAVGAVEARQLVGVTVDDTKTKRRYARRDLEASDT